MLYICVPFIPYDSLNIRKTVIVELININKNNIQYDAPIYSDFFLKFNRIIFTISNASAFDTIVPKSLYERLFTASATVILYISVMLNITAISITTIIKKANTEIAAFTTVFPLYKNDIANENNIIAKYDVREDIAYYNESEPDIEKLKLAKVEGEKQRTKNDLFFLSLAIAVREGIADINAVKKVLNGAFAELSFDNLKSVKFVGDGTYLEFTDKYVEIRPSGTDAKTKAYAGGENLEMIEKFSRVLGNYSGDRTELHKELISDEFYENSKEKALDYYLQFVEKDANNEVFVIPEYKF